MKKNIVFMMDIDLKGEGRWASSRRAPYQFSINSWRNWCDKNNAELFLMTELLLDHNEMGICWQRYYLFDILKANDIEYDQVLMVDADTIVHPDCPNVFELSDRKLVGVHCDASYEWVLRSLENYSKYAFNGFMPKWWNYIDCGFILVNETHEDFFKTIVDYYWQNKDLFKQLESLHVGTDQTPFNILVERENIDLKLLPYEFNMVDMIRKEILTEDLLFTKIGWIYQYNCIPNNTDNRATYYWMKKSYEYLYEKN
jgi:hypothetical protein